VRFLFSVSNCHAKHRWLQQCALNARPTRLLCWNSHLLFTKYLLLSAKVLPIFYLPVRTMTLAKFSRDKVYGSVLRGTCRGFFQPIRRITHPPYRSMAAKK
jgi:hypothetical protein